jgi:hypothetical protein
MVKKSSSLLTGLLGNKDLTNQEEDKKIANLFTGPDLIFVSLQEVKMKPSLVQKIISTITNSKKVRLGSTSIRQPNVMSTEINLSKFCFIGCDNKDEFSEIFENMTGIEKLTISELSMNNMNTAMSEDLFVALITPLSDNKFIKNLDISENLTRGFSKNETLGNPSKPFLMLIHDQKS